MTTRPTIKIDSPADVVEILPFMLGHFPDDSIVFHCPGPGYVDGPSMTCPLPDDPADWTTVADSAACNFIHFAQSRGRAPGSEIVVYLCHDPRPGQSPEETAELLRPLADRLVDVLTEHRGCPERTFGLVAGRWWDFDCEVPGCCEGEPFPNLDNPDSLTVRLTQLGYTPGRRTRDILAEFQPLTPEAAPGLLRALRDEGTNHLLQRSGPNGRQTAQDATHLLLEGAIGDFRKGGTELAHDVAARLIHGLQDNHARDHALEFAEDDDLPHARRLWTHLARCCVAPYTHYAVPVLTALAWVAWRQDDKITARLALREALTADPDYAMADMLHTGINNGTDPQGLLDILREARAERLNR